MVKIYTLIDPDDYCIKYVGKTINTLKKRLSGHISHAKRRNSSTYVSHWIRTLLEENKKPQIVLIEEVSNKNWSDREKYWIKYYRNQILNQSEGGEHGMLGYTCTQTHKDNISKALKGVKRPDDVKIKISKSHIGKKLSVETKLKLRNINLGKKATIKSRIQKSHGTIIQLTLDNKIIAEYPTLGYAVEKTGLNKANISSVVKGRRKTCGGFKWRKK